MTSSHERISIVYYVIGIGTFMAAAIWAVLTFYVQEQNNLTYSYGAPEIHINMEQIKLPHNNDLDKSDKHLYIQTTVTVHNKGDKAVNLNLPDDFLTLQAVTISNNDRMQFGKKYYRRVPYGATEYFLRKNTSKTFQFVNKVDTPGLYYAFVYSPLDNQQQDIIKSNKGNIKRELSWKNWNYIVIN